VLDSRTKTVRVVKDELMILKEEYNKEKNNLLQQTNYLE